VRRADRVPGIALRWWRPEGLWWRSRSPIGGADQRGEVGRRGLVQRHQLGRVALRVTMRRVKRRPLAAEEPFRQVACTEIADQRATDY